MSILIDTALDARITVPGSAEEAWAKRWLADRGPLGISAVTVYERTFGFLSAQRTTRSSAEAQKWRERLAAYRMLVNGPAYEVYSLNELSGFIAGILYGSLPSRPPASWVEVTYRRRERSRNRSEVKRVWLLDVLIASTALAHGLALLTPHADDYAIFSRALESIQTPSGEPLCLNVLSFPEDAP